MAKQNVAKLTNSERTLIILTRRATLGRTMTYEQLAQILELPDSGNALGRALTPILIDVFDWCHRHGLPKLTSLVVRKSGGDQGIPGCGFWQAMRMPVLSREEKRELVGRYHQECYNFYTL